MLPDKSTACNSYVEPGWAVFQVQETPSDAGSPETTGEKSASPCFFILTATVAPGGIYPFKSTFPEIEALGICLVWSCCWEGWGTAVDTIRSVSLSAGAVTARIMDSAICFPSDFTTAFSSYVVPFSAVVQLQLPPSTVLGTVDAMLNAESPIRRSWTSMIASVGRYPLISTFPDIVEAVLGIGTCD